MPLVIIATSDKEDWCLKPLAYFMTKYWPDANVLVAGFRTPPFPIPYPFVSLGDMCDYPYSKWSNAIIKLLSSLTDELILWSMEDFWPIRQVDEQAITMLANYMLEHPNISRIDLTTDREYAAGAKDIGALGWLDLITNEPPAAYHLSFQVGLWRRTELLRFLIPDENPHEVELRGTERMIKAKALVLGTRQNPCRVIIAVQNGHIAIQNTYQVPKPVISDEDLDVMLNMIPAEHP